VKQFVIILFLFSSLMSASFSARYNVDVSLFGEVGYIDISLDEKPDTYIMTMVATTTGAAAALTANRVETYISKGKIINKVYIPSSFVKIKKTNYKYSHMTYRFKHDKKEISLLEEKEKLVTHSEFDPISFKIVQKEVMESSKKNSVVEKYYANDVLSSFLNTTNNLGKQKEYALEAIGAHNDEKDVSLSLLDDMQKTKLTEKFSSGIGNICNLNVTPFDKEDKPLDILIAFDNEGHMKEAELGDIFWIGKITARRAYYKMSCNKDI